ncbi:hypothetical protein [Thermobifida halotolerans]|uniref:hypothetical protein n=1 Tax=Thermobifida halotolerans TaxID=483545 RepID=UPI0008395443|nr:hypothetical protein [Thermobifida halotolerans]
MSTTVPHPSRLDAFTVGIIALVGDANAADRRGRGMALAVAPHDHHVVSVQPADAPLWTPLISREEALAALPGRDASAAEVLTAVEALAERIAPPGRSVDVGARGVFVAAGTAPAAAPPVVVAPRSGWSTARTAVSARAA